MERELGALAHRPGEDQEGNDEQRDRVGAALVEEDLDRLADLERRLTGRAGVDEDGHDPEREADVADAVDDERLLGRQRRRVLAIPEPDQQVARQPDQFPGHEHDQPAVGQDQQQHREHEQVEVGEEAPEPRIVAHVADRVQVDQQPDRGHHDQQRRGQRVDHEADLDHEVAGRDPGEPVEGVAVRLFRARQQRGGAGQDLDDQAHRDQPHPGDRQDRDPVRLLAQPTPNERRERKPTQRQQHQRRDQTLKIHDAEPRSAASDESRRRRRRARERAHPKVRERMRRSRQRTHRPSHDAPSCSPQLHCFMASYSSTSGVCLLR